MKRPSIYAYLDYRAFLHDIFHYKKLVNSTYSYRLFARKAGFSSPNFLKLVTNGQRNLTNQSAAKIARGFGLKKREREFLENLVFMNQASTTDEKNYYYTKLTAAKGFSSIGNLNKDAYEYFSKWYYPVIREVAALGDRNHSAKDIAAALNPQITPSQAEKALQVLTRLKLIRKDKNGLWEQCSEVLSTGPEVQSLTIAGFHKEMMKLGIESLDRFPGDQRDITALTLSIKASDLPELKKKLGAFRRELLNMSCEKGSQADQAMQINFQAFPVSARLGKEQNDEE